MGRKRKVIHFKSKENYLKWLRYGHATGVFRKTPGHMKVYIKGKPHKVKHVRSRRKKRKRRARKR